MFLLHCRSAVQGGCKNGTGEGLESAVDEELTMQSRTFVDHTMRQNPENPRCISMS
jgi:hypothetical protein